MWKLMWEISGNISKEVIFDLRLEWWCSKSCEDFRKKHFRLKKQQILNLWDRNKLRIFKEQKEKSVWLMQSIVTVIWKADRPRALWPLYPRIKSLRFILNVNRIHWTCFNRWRITFNILEQMDWKWSKTRSR